MQKNNKGLHICGRCGAKIEENYLLGKIETTKDIEIIYSVHRFYDIRKMDIDIGNFEIELCHKCRKDFGRFMRNEEITK